MVKSFIRSILAVITYNLYYRFVTNSYEVTRDGKPLIPGITAVVAAKNESYTLPFCLRSLVGVVDQVVCIDNGSTDNTMELMKQFKSEFDNALEIDIISLPDGLLGDCREAGLQATRYQWHLRWDADMVCKTSGAESMLELRNKVLKDDRPRTIQLPRTNLWGDFKHTRSYDPVDQGEPILVRFSKYIKYVEYGKFDAIKVPFFYKMTKENNRYYFHCQGLKPDVNLIYRYHYFDWRDANNKYDKGKVPDDVVDFEKFKLKWNQKWYGTNDPKSLKWRFQRQRARYVIPYDVAKYGEYPKILLDAINSGRQQLEIKYKDGRPYIRIDHDDLEMEGYQPTKEDLEWEQELYKKREAGEDV